MGADTESVPGESRTVGPADAGRFVISLCALLALRWPAPVVLAAVRGEAAIDATIAAFVASFALGVAGLPGFLAATWLRRERADAWWIRYGLGATLASSVTIGAWTVVSVREIGATLGRGLVATFLVPVVVTAIASIGLRARVSRVTHR